MSSEDGFMDAEKIDELLTRVFNEKITKSSPLERHAEDRKTNLKSIEKWYKHETRSP